MLSVFQIFVHIVYKVIKFNYTILFLICILKIFFTFPGFNIRTRGPASHLQAGQGLKTSPSLSTITKSQWTMRRQERSDPAAGVEDIIFASCPEDPVPRQLLCRIQSRRTWPSETEELANRVVAYNAPVASCLKASLKLPHNSPDGVGQLLSSLLTLRKSSCARCVDHLRSSKAVMNLKKTGSSCSPRVPAANILGTHQNLDLKNSQLASELSPDRTCYNKIFYEDV
jgi:hypothetical protein